MQRDPRLMRPRLGNTGRVLPPFPDGFKEVECFHRELRDFVTLKQLISIAGSLPDNLVYFPHYVRIEFLGVVADEYQGLVPLTGDTDKVIQLYGITALGPPCMSGLRCFVVDDTGVFLPVRQSSRDFHVSWE